MTRQAGAAPMRPKAWPGHQSPFRCGAEPITPTGRSLIVPVGQRYPNRTTGGIPAEPQNPITDDPFITYSPDPEFEEEPC